MSKISSNSISLSKYQEIYKVFTKIRSLELEISKKYSEGKMRCPVHLSVGQEIIPSILSLFVKKQDSYVSTHRGHAHYISKKGNINEMIAEIYGKKSGTSRGNGGSMHLIDTKVNFMGTTAIVGNSIPVGVGLGLANKIKKQNSLSYIFIGDGATEEGVFYESINFAALKKIPVIFICENNFYSVYSSLKDRQPKERKIIKIVEGMGIKSIKSKSKSIEDIYNIIKYGVNYCKKNSKPIFLEFQTYRWLEHCGPNYDDDLNYRDNSLTQKFKKNDFLKILEKKLSQKFIKITNNQNMKSISNAFKFAETSKKPSQSDLKKYVFKK